MRDLRITTYRPTLEQSVSVAPLVDHVRNAHGRAALGLVTILTDVNGAGVALPAADPDWIATADLSYHEMIPVTEGPVISRATLVRAGANIIVVGVDVFDGHGTDDPDAAELAGTGLMTFARIPRSASAAKVVPFRTGVRTTMARDDSALAAPMLDAIGLRVVDGRGGVVELARHDYVRNSFGTINGGVLGMVFQGAAEAAVRARGHDLVATDISIHYLAQCKAGPVRTDTAVRRVRDDHAVCDVRVVDAGNDDLLLTLATVTLTR